MGVQAVVLGSGLLEVAPHLLRTPEGMPSHIARAEGAVQELRLIDPRGMRQGLPHPEDRWFRRYFCVEAAVWLGSPSWIR